jgi:hypothetical protein
VACLIAVTTAVAVTASVAAGQPQRRQIAVATLTGFRVVLTVTRGGRGHRFRATITAAGYRRAGARWQC